MGNLTVERRVNDGPAHQLTEPLKRSRGHRLDVRRQDVPRIGVNKCHRFTFLPSLLVSMRSVYVRHMLTIATLTKKRELL